MASAVGKTSNSTLRRWASCLTSPITGSVRAGSDHEALTFPGYPFLDGQRRMTELPAESLGGFFLAFVDFAAINYDIVLIGAAVDLDGAESEFVEMHTRTP